MSQPPAKVTMLNPSDHPPLAPTYSQVSVSTLTTTSKLVCTSGQPALSPGQDPMVPLPFRKQVEAALGNLEKCMEVAGVSKADIIMHRQYIVRPSELSPEDFQARTDIWVQWLGGLPAPPETFIGVHSMALPSILYEIEVTALIS